MKSKNNNFELIIKSQLMADHVFNGRQGEQRFGNYLTEDIKRAKFCILGVSESIGPFANYGRVGAEFAFTSFYKQFVSWPYQDQSVDLIGNVIFKSSFPEDVHAASSLVEELDAFLLEILLAFVNSDQVPIVIGGGHNNALPIMRWAAQVKSCNTVINLDAHTDCRALNRRHSGNSFSTALSEGTITKYHAFGVHAYSLTPFMTNFMKKFNVELRTYEDYLLNNRVLLSDIKRVLHDSNEAVGLEIDLDCIANMPSSAASPSGWNLDQIRAIMLQIDTQELAYIHLTEGAVISSDHERMLGRSLGYLCLDAIAIRESH
jgi:formiminoglutamase